MQVREKLQAARLKLRQLQAAAATPLDSSHAQQSVPQYSPYAAAQEWTTVRRQPPPGRPAHPTAADAASASQSLPAESAEFTSSPNNGRPARRKAAKNLRAGQLSDIAGRAIMQSSQHVTAKAAVAHVQPGMAQRTSDQAQFHRASCSAASDPDELDDDDSCVVCMEALPQVSFQPCSHAIVCRPCAAKIFAGSCECPLCRSTIQGLTQLSLT